MEAVDRMSPPPLPPANSEIYKNKCTYRFQGAKGAQWDTERYIATTQNCDVESLVVRDNNPNATIVAVNRAWRRFAV